MNIQHPVADPHDDPGPIAIAPCHGDMTNDQSPFLGALVVADPQEEPVALHDLDHPPENFPPPGMPHVSQAEPRPSPCAQHLHNVEKNDIVYKIINHHGNKPIHQLLFNLHRGNTTHNSLLTTPTLIHTPTTTTNRPPTSGNPGDNGRTIPIPQTHPIHPNGLTAHYSKPSASYNDPYDSSTKPLTAFSSDHTTSHRQKKKPSHTSGFGSIPCSCQCPSRTRCHQPSRRFQGRVVQKYQVCLKSS